MTSENWGRLATKALQERAGKKISVRVLLAYLKACSRTRDFKKAKAIHAEAVACGQDSNIYVLSTLIRMYAKCGSLLDARSVFNSIQKPDVVCWNNLLLGYAENGEGLVALDLFSMMKATGCTPDSITYVAVLKACTALAMDEHGSGKKECLERGRNIHSELGSSLNNSLQNMLIHMYAKCGSMIDARHVFNSMRKPNVVSWTALLLGYAENGDGLVALDMFSRMKASGCVPDSVTYVAALKACTSLAMHGDESGKKNCLERGRGIHSEIGCNLNHYVQNTLIDMYVKCGSFVEARCIFNRIHKPDVVSWNSLLLGYAENGAGLVALDMFSSMKASGCAPNNVTYVAVLKACTSLAVEGDFSAKDRCLERGREIHLEIGSHLDNYLQSTLIDMYAKCGSMVDACRVFNSMEKPDVVSWSVLLLAYVENGEGLIALNMFSRMMDSGCAPDSVTYVAALKACTSLAVDGDGSGKQNCLERGREIHARIGSNLNLHVQNTLIDMYANCGSMVEAHRVFDNMHKRDVVSWTALLLGYVENGEGLLALDLFSRMKATGCAPNSVTYVAALRACGLVGALALGRKVHSEIKVFSAHVVTCLVDLYGKCGSMVEAHEVFDLHPEARAVTTWNALLAGYGSFGDSNSVFNLFKAMQDEGFRPDAVTFVCILSCCSHAGLVEKARECFGRMGGQYGVVPDAMHYSCMVDVLGRANLLNEALVLLQKMPCSPDAVTWMSLLGACRKWKNVEIGRMAFQSLMGIDVKFASAHMLMAQVYGGKDTWVEQGRILETRTKRTSLL